MPKGSLPKYGEKTKVVRLPESIANAVTLLLESGIDSVTLLHKLAEIQPQQGISTVTACNSIESAIAPTPDELKEMLEGLIEKRLSHHNAILNDLNQRLSKLEGQLEQREDAIGSPVTTPAPTKDEIKESPIAPLATSNNVVSAPAGEKLSGKLLKSKITSIARRLKNDGCPTSEGVIRQKIFEKYPYVADWVGDDPDSREEIVAELKREYQSKNSPQSSIPWKGETGAFLDEVQW